MPAAGVLHDELSLQQVSCSSLLSVLRIEGSAPGSRGAWEGHKRWPALPMHTTSMGTGLSCCSVTSEGGHPLLFAHSLTLPEGLKGKSLQLNPGVEEDGSWGRRECCSTPKRPP